VSWLRPSQRFEESLSAATPNVNGRDHEPQDKGRDQESVCPADNNGIGARRAAKGDNGPVKQRQAQPRQSGVQISSRAMLAEASLRMKLLLTNVNTMGEPKMTTSPPRPCSRLPMNHFGSGGKIPAQK
jgi:hypothetical protein